jgi:hypothetical protein
MMSLRILKKLSKAAAPILVKHYAGQYGEAFLSDRHDNHTGLKTRCKCKGKKRKREFHYCLYKYPLAGTPMVGATEGYYEPEWEEKTAYEWLHEAVRWQNRPTNASDEEWADIMRVARVTLADQTFITDMLNKQIAELEAESSNKSKVQEKP